MQVEPTSGRVARTPLPGLSEGAAIASGGGSIWVGTEEALARIDPSSGDVTAMIDEAFTGATGWVTVAFGTVWVRNSTSFLLAIDPTTDQIVKQVTVLRSPAEAPSSARSTISGSARRIPGSCSSSTPKRSCKPDQRPRHSSSQEVGNTSTTRPCSTPKSQTSIGGGSTPRLVRAVQTWLRWSVP